jgi:hypothetical protein
MRPATALVPPRPTPAALVRDGDATATTGAVNLRDDHPHQHGFAHPRLLPGDVLPEGSIRRGAPRRPVQKISATSRPSTLPRATPARAEAERFGTTTKRRGFLPRPCRDVLSARRARCSTSAAHREVGGSSARGTRRSIGHDDLPTGESAARSIEQLGLQSLMTRFATTRPITRGRSTRLPCPLDEPFGCF